MAVISPTQTTPAYFESLYAEAQGDASRISWADLQPNPALVTWLNAVAPALIRCGARVCVVGCGLGDDARELMKRGYEVTAFDCSPTAITWAKSIDPSNARCYSHADLFSVPGRWRHRFDLVVEINTIHALSPDLQVGAVRAISEMCAPHGYLLVICRGTDEPAAVDDGPPWPLTRNQLLEATSAIGMKPIDSLSVFEDDETPPVLRMRGLFKRV